MCIFDEEFDSDSIYATAEKLGFSQDQVERYLRFAYCQLNCYFGLDDLVNCELEYLQNIKKLWSPNIENFISQKKLPHEVVSGSILKSTMLSLLTPY